MRTFTLALVFILLRCSPPSGTQEATQDSLTRYDTSHSEAEIAQTQIPQSVATQDTSQLNNTFNEKRDATLNETAVFYQVSVSTKQYEAVSDITWYFDSTFSPRYVSYTWSAEGQDGSTELIVENGEVVCGQVEELNTTDRWCSLTGGTKTEWNDETGEAEISLLPSNYGGELNTQLNQFLNTLKDIIKQGERSDDDEFVYTIKSEHKIDVGFEFTETVETRIPKELYDQLIQ